MTVALNLQNQIVSALNRGVVLSGPNGGVPGYSSEYWGTETNWYPANKTQNLFSQFMHKGTIAGTSIFVNGQAYGFPYDENPGPGANWGRWSAQCPLQIRPGPRGDHHNHDHARPLVPNGCPRPKGWGRISGPAKVSRGLVLGEFHRDSVAQPVGLAPLAEAGAWISVHLIGFGGGSFNIFTNPKGTATIRGLRFYPNTYRLEVSLNGQGPVLSDPFKIVRAGDAWRHFLRHR